MSKRNTTIEINGKRYDASTGDLLSPDGKIVHKAAVKPAKPSAHHTVRHPAKPAAGHAPKASRTLMRSAVKKPLQKSTPAEEPSLSVVVSKSVTRVDNKRLTKAQRVRRSQLISHFSPTVMQPSVPAYVPPAPAPEPLAKKPIARTAAKPQGKPQTTADLLDRALQNATSYRQPVHKSRKAKRGRRTATTAAVLALLLVVGVAGSQQLPAERLRTAAAQAGFNATLPDYKPAGFSLQKLNAGPGIVATNFHSNSDNRVYTITQRQSTWDSIGLRDNFVASIDANYQTAVAGNHTIYLYSNGNATWISDGIWYIIQSHDSLNQRQLVDLAASM